MSSTPNSHPEDAKEPTEHVNESRMAAYVKGHLNLNNEEQRHLDKCQQCQDQSVVIGKIHRHNLAFHRDHREHASRISDAGIAEYFSDALSLKEQEFYRHCIETCPVCQDIARSVQDDFHFFGINVTVPTLKGRLQGRKTTSFPRFRSFSSGVRRAIQNPKMAFVIGMTAASLLIVISGVVYNVFRVSSTKNDLSHFPSGPLHKHLMPASTESDGYFAFGAPQASPALLATAKSLHFFRDITFSVDILRFTSREVSDGENSGNLRIKQTLTPDDEAHLVELQRLESGVIGDQESMCASRSLVRFHAAVRGEGILSLWREYQGNIDLVEHWPEAGYGGNLRSLVFANSGPIASSANDSSAHDRENFKTLYSAIPTPDMVHGRSELDKTESGESAGPRLRYILLLSSEAPDLGEPARWLSTTLASHTTDFVYAVVSCIVKITS